MSNMTIQDLHEMDAEQLEKALKRTEVQNLIDQHVGQQIRDIRKARSMSQTDLGREIDVTFQQIQKYENGRNRVSAGTLVKMAKALEVRIEAFFAGLPGRAVTGQYEGVKLDPEVADIFRAVAKLPKGEQKEAIRSILEVVRGVVALQDRSDGPKPGGSGFGA